MQFRGMTFWAKVIVVLAFATVQALASENDGLVAQLRQHFRLASGKLDAKGRPIVSPGKILIVNEEGIVGFASNQSSLVQLCFSEFQAGELHPPRNPACVLDGQQRRVFKVDDPVCITAIDAYPSNDAVSLSLINCDDNGDGGQPGAFRAVVVFRFPKSSMSATSASRIEETIGQLLASGKPDAADAPTDYPHGSAPAAEVSSSAKPDRAAIPQPNPQPQSTAPSSGPAAPLPATQVSIGQTQREVEAILGAPSAIADLGAKAIYFYPDLKIVFIDGKVSQIQQL